jgi:hypothetical protein
MSHRFRFVQKLAVGEVITILDWHVETETLKGKGGVEQEYVYLTLKDEKDRQTTSQRIREQLQTLHPPIRAEVVKESNSFALKILD